MKHSRPTHVVSSFLALNARIETSENDEKLRVRTDFRIGKAETEAPAGKLSTKRAFVELLLDGVEFAPGRRFGEPLKAPPVEELERIKSLTAEASLSSSITASVGYLRQPDASAKATIEGALKSNDAQNSKVKTLVDHSFVKAKPGDFWEISEGGADLEATYITADETLCLLERLEGSNRAAATINGYVYRKDLDFKIEGVMAKWRNKDKAILAFFVERMGRDQAASEKLILSTQEFTDE